MRISGSAKISPKAIIHEDVYIGDNVTIEDNVTIDIGCIIRDNVHIKKNTYVGARCILGEYLQDYYYAKQNQNHPLCIGENGLIRSETIIYGDCEIGDYFQTGHRVTIREKSIIQAHVRIGTLSDIQGHCSIGNYVNLHSNVHVSQGSQIGDYVWLFPYVVLTNDPQPPSTQMCGVTIEEFAVVATQTVILPGVHIGKDVLIGAGSVVTKSVKDKMVAYGSPAKEHGTVEQILDKSGNVVYPWRYTFDRGMPWEGIGYEKWSKNDGEK